MKAISDFERSKAVQLLRDFPNGLTEKHLAEQFGTLQRAQNIFAELQASSVVAVVPGRNHVGQVAYKIAKDTAEIDRAVAGLESHISHYQARIDGLKRAFAAGGAHPPRALFEES